MRLIDCAVHAAATLGTRLTLRLCRLRKLVQPLRLRRGRIKTLLILIIYRLLALTALELRPTKHTLRRHLTAHLLAA